MSDRENEIIEIVKRIETPQRESEDNNEKEETNEINKTNEIEKAIYIDESFYTEEYQEEKNESSKKVLPILLGITTIGVMGYLGVKYLNQNNQVNQTPNNIISNHIVNKEAEKITTYTEELAIEEDVIAVLSAQKKQAQAQEEVSKPISKKEEEIPKEIEKEEVVVQKQEILKKEKVVQEKQIEEQEKISKPIPKREEETPKEIEKQEVVIQKQKIVKKEKVIAKKQIKENTFIIKYEAIKPRVIIVRRGDSLASIAKRFYGNDMDFKRIIRANPRIKNSKTHIHLGEKLIIPRKDNKTKRRYVIAKKGYTLAYIAKKVYGSRDKISKIVRANQKIKSRNSTIHLGQKVYLP
ncbi:hypothetical protein MNB_SV-14-1056 [hydrothermal vent metagenome]|uniref:LysM domain-containing protein n=1 Tax=hydrothermal vent metagenome TaxID=652676 RepID=A0A1W1BYN0_9ZZZZ